ncbi:MAG TPA: response regulator transcription factor [Blastocatellia bacterium]|nr:response regulator transcription factor [Blastocatellia bacterium]
MKDKCPPSPASSTIPARIGKHARVAKNHWLQLTAPRSFEVKKVARLPLRTKRPENKGRRRASPSGQSAHEDSSTPVAGSGDEKAIAVAQTSVCATTRVLLISEHALIRVALHAILQTLAGLVLTAEAASCADALAAASISQADIILLDLDAEDDDQIASIPQLLSAFERARILVLADAPNPEAYRRAVSAGATGILLKEQAPELLTKAIEKMRSGEAWLDRATMATVIREMSRVAADHKNGGETGLAMLSRREREVAILAGKGLTNKQVADRLFISPATAHHHLTSIFNKLGLTNRFELVQYLYQHGLMKPLAEPTAD